MQVDYLEDQWMNKLLFQMTLEFGGKRKPDRPLIEVAAKFLKSMDI